MMLIFVWFCFVEFIGCVYVSIKVSLVLDNIYIVKLIIIGEFIDVFHNVDFQTVY